MATREENLKKINDELEKLDDEELEQIAGGRTPYIDDSEPKKDIIQINDLTKLFVKS